MPRNRGSDFMAPVRPRSLPELLGMKQDPDAGKKSHRLMRVVEVQTTQRTQMKKITAEVERVVAESRCESGVCYVYVPHTTAGVTVNEGHDPDVARDMEATLDRLVPESRSYRHAEGNADSHIKAALAGSTVTVFVEDGKLALGRWQAIFFCEFDGPRRREVRVKIVPDAAA